MKITYKNFTIEDDRNCIRVGRHRIADKWINEWKLVEVDTFYPNTLLEALIKINDRMRWDDNETYTLKEWIDRLEIINNKFIEDIKLLLK